MKIVISYCFSVFLLLHVTTGLFIDLNDRMTFPGQAEAFCQPHPYQESASIVETGKTHTSIASENPTPVHYISQNDKPLRTIPTAFPRIHRHGVVPTFTDIGHLRV